MLFRSRRETAARWCRRPETPTPARASPARARSRAPFRTPPARADGRAPTTRCPPQRTRSRGCRARRSHAVAANLSPAAATAWRPGTAAGGGPSVSLDVRTRSCAGRKRRRARAIPGPRQHWLPEPPARLAGPLASAPDGPDGTKRHRCPPETGSFSLVRPQSPAGGKLRFPPAATLSPRVPYRAVSTRIVPAAAKRGRSMVASHASTW